MALEQKMNDDEIGDVLEVTLRHRNNQHDGSGIVPHGEDWFVKCGSDDLYFLIEAGPMDDKEVCLIYHCIW